MSKFHNVLVLLLATGTSFILGGAVVYLTWQPAAAPRPGADVKAIDAAKPPAEPKPMAAAEPPSEPKLPDRESPIVAAPKSEPKSEPRPSIDEKPAVVAEPKPEPRSEPKPPAGEKPLVVVEPESKPKPQPEPRAAPGPTESAPETAPRADSTLQSRPKAEVLTVPRRSYGIGREANAQEIAGWDIDVRPDGQGLPSGSGTAKQGEEIYMAKCAACHGEFGEGAARWPPVAGGKGTLASHDPNKTVGSYFPYLSSVFDYVRHTMPFGDAQSLKNDELYAVVAYLLYLNSLVEEDFVLSKETWASVKMPNQAGFIDDDRESTEKSFWNPTPCMTRCKDEVKIIGRARAVDVTPDEK